MALKEYKLPFGRGFQTVMLPEEHVSDVLEGVPTAACDIKEATVECMRRPIGSAPLAEKVQKGDKVCLIIADITRAWNHARDFTVHVVNELNLAGIPDEDIFIVSPRVPTGRTLTRKISNVWEKKWRDALPCTSMTAGIKTCSPVWA